MLQRDTKARLEKSGFWVFAQFRFVSGRVRSPKRLSVARVKSIQEAQRDGPVALHLEEETNRRWWLFRDQFYREDEGLSQLEVRALALQLLAQKDRRIKRAVALMEQTAAFTSPSRAAIPDDVKIFVWNRDGGRCVACGSREHLEYDHVIPVARGGANSARNLQLLCQGCNRSKGAAIA